MNEEATLRQQLQAALDAVEREARSAAEAWDHTCGIWQTSKHPALVRKMRALAQNTSILDRRSEDIGEIMASKVLIRRDVEIAVQSASLEIRSSAANRASQQW